MQAACVAQLRSRTPLWLLRIEAVRRAEVVAPRAVNQLGRQLNRRALEETNINDAVEQVARLAGFHLPVLKHVVVQHVIENRLLDAKPTRERGAADDFDVSRRRRRLHPPAPTHAAGARSRT